ncbi:MAG TPA: methyltransferase domain-containing protein [Actinophytocola sp.]|jgi:SAM-dependent methyltransferase|uniref:class I SAM-dependent methyltransferase n=1 Tax=Actinophytocola sp. TaxID=1872138 RepID=UPI002DFEFEBE|nr:methyltransferase domain-containing protein [Actinophytocola sp.]
MTVTGFDPIAFKAMQRINWNAISAGWSSCQEEFERGGAPVTARLLELGGVRAGHRVLDVATGVGEPALTVAEVVGPAGYVVGVDLAPDMIAVARRRAGAVSNVEFRTGDLESLEFGAGAFDVVLSRWGLMFAVDHVAAFRSLAHVLVPGGVLAAAVWGPWSQVPMMALGYQVLAARLELAPPPPGSPGPFSMADPGILEAELAAAGFEDVTVTPFDVPFVLDSPERYVEFTRASTPPGLQEALRARFGRVDDPETWAAVLAAVLPYRVADGLVSLPSKALLLRAAVPVGR